MTSPQSPLPNRQNSTHQSSDPQDFEQALGDVEQSLRALKERYIQVQQDQAQRTQLRQQMHQVRQEFQQTHLSSLKTELNQLQDQLDQLEIHLESQLFSWKTLREPFWQIVRFGGLGIVIGWFLAFAVLKTPKPTPPARTAIPSSEYSKP